MLRIAIDWSSYMYIITHNILLKLLLTNSMSYEETVKDIEKTFGMLPGFMKNTSKIFFHKCGHCLRNIKWENH